MDHLPGSIIPLDNDPPDHSGLKSGYTIIPGTTVPVDTFIPTPVTPTPIPSTTGTVSCHLVPDTSHLIRWLKVDPRAEVPVKKHWNDAGYDLAILEDVYIPAGRTRQVNTGLAVALPHNVAGFIKPRSSAFRDGLDLDGTIDAGYRGEILLQIRNLSGEGISLKAGRKVAQLVPVVVLNYGEFFSTSIDVTSLEWTTRGEGGFGSTGQ